MLLSSWITWIWIFTCPEFTCINLSSSVCTNKDFTGVSKPWEFRFGSDIHQSGRYVPTPRENRAYMMISKAYQVPCCGYITGWEFQASLRAQIRQLTFLTWRPMQTSPAVLTLTSQHHFWYTKGRSQTVTVKLTVQEHVLVNQGDIIGWHAPLGDVIDYRTTNEKTSTYIIAHSVSNLTVGMNYTINDQHHSGRIYGIKAMLTSAQPPRFINLPQKITLKCPLDDNHYITTIEVSDGIKVKYNLHGYNPWFSVDELTGEVRTIRSLQGNLTSDISIVVTSTCDVQATVVLPVQCIDLVENIHEKQFRGQKSAFGIISHASTEVNKPVYHVTFLESLTSETILRVFNITNVHQDKIICITANTQPTVPVNVLYTSGNKLLMRSHYNILFNITQTILVNVTCIWGDGYAMEEETVIHVLKDLQPVFENLPAQITVSARHVFVGDTVFQVSAIDKESQLMTFGSENCSCPFSVNIDGSVIVSNDLRKTTLTSFVMKVFVNDGFHNIGPVLLNVLLRDTNHHPYFINLLHEVVVPENKQGVIMTIQAHDQDPHDNIIITWFWEDTTALTFFTFNETTNQLSVNPTRHLDFDLLMATMNRTSFVLFVSVNDGALFSNTEKVMIYVTDVNKEPTFLVKKLYVTCNEGKTGDLVSAIDLRDIAVDPDHDLLTFSLLQVNGTHWSTFIIDSASGWLNLSHDVDVTREKSPLVLVVHVIAEDPEKLSAKIEIEIRVKFVNIKPILLGLPAHATVFENISLSEIVFTVTFADGDGDHIILLYHSEVEMKHNVVSVNETSGEVKIVTIPELSQGQNVYISINITAYDYQDISEPGLLSITVVGVNDPPRFPSDEYRFIINETEVGNYIATQDIWVNLDLDPQDKLTFFIIGGMGENMTFVHSQTGEIGIIGGYDIDIEGNGNNLIIFLMVIDTYGLNSTTKVIIMITDINDNSPVVENDGETFVIFSDVTPGLKIGHIKATDIDSGENGALMFSLTGSSLNDTSDYFINSRDGWILLTGMTVPENFITIYVFVSDSGWPANTATATFHVMMAKSFNETIAQSPQLQHSASTGESSSPTFFVLTGVVTCCIVIITILSHQLWKARKVLRITQPEQRHDAYHEYRFQWVPRQIAEEGHEADASISRSSLSVIPSFLGISVSNQNFQYESAILSASQEQQDSCSIDQLAHVQMVNVDRECIQQNHKRETTENDEITGTAIFEATQTGNE